jgi:hypothetical protein
MTFATVRIRRPVRSQEVVLFLALTALVGVARVVTAFATPQDAPISALRERGAALFEERRWDEAEQVLRAVTARKEAVARDFTNVACVLLSREVDPFFRRDPDPKTAPEIDRWCAKAMKRDANDAAAQYLAGVAWWAQAVPVDPQRALPFLERAAQLAPDDAFVHYHLGMLFEWVEQPEKALPHFEKVAALGFEFAGVAYSPSIYRLGSLLRRRKQGDDLERGMRLIKESDKLPKPKNNADFLAQVAVGRLGHVRVEALAPAGAPAAGRALPMQWERAIVLLDDAGRLRSLDLGDVDGDRRTDVVAAGATGLWIATRRGGSIWEEERLAAGDFDRVLVAELDDRHDPGEGDPQFRARSSILAFGKAGARLFFAQQGGWFCDDSPSLPPLAPIRAVQPVDFDHDGMLDLLFLTDGGVTLLRNHGPTKDPRTGARIGPVTFDDATEAASLKGVHADWVAIEDFDHDQDVDLLFGGADVPTLLFSSLRRGRFEQIGPERTHLPSPLAREPLVGDFDHDGVADVIAGRGESALLHGKGDGTFDAPRRCATIPDGVAPAELFDVDLDAQLDAVSADGEGHLALSLGVGGGTDAPPLPIAPDVTAARAPILDDVDLDGAADLVAMGETGAWLVKGAREIPPPRVRILLRGRKDNRMAIGTIVEVRAGARYERRFLHRPTLLFAFPPSPDVDPVLRLTWPDGVVQYPLQSQTKEDMELLLPTKDEPINPKLPVDPRAELRLLVEQKKGPPGSCPFLYAWDGSRYRFITDVLGATPLGLPIDEKRFVPPAHDEFVRLAPDQVRPVDGEYRFQLTEELREVTYLDRAQLWVVDHAADVELHPEERFCFPPFPPKRIHAMQHVVGLVKAVDQDGVDWTDALARNDETPAIPFRPIGEVFRGIATASTLELTLPDAAKTAKRVRLLMTGWLQWGDASVNLAAAKNGSVEFVPPIFSVPDGHGEAGSSSGWRDCGPPVGFPTGKTKTMVLDVGDLLNRADPRLRITTTLELYWDSIRVALDDDDSPSHGDAPFTVTKLEPKSANLGFRGFSQPTARRPDQPQLFDWSHLEANARWNQHDGMLTRYGDVFPLLGDPDDRFAILSAGDTIDLRFDASAIPPPAPGMSRTWLLYLDGWAKDGDPNTVTSQTVEPLPFHAMSGYPYGPDEHYPDDEVHALYQREWNTRPGRILVPPLAPNAMAPR